MQNLIIFRDRQAFASLQSISIGEKKEEKKELI